MKADRDGQIEISGYPLKMETIKYIAAVDIGEDVCVAAGGNAVIRLIICVGSSETFPVIYSVYISCSETFSVDGSWGP